MTANRYACLIAGIFLAASSAAKAEGVTAYLPMYLEPEIERQIERVLILADEPILKRPFSVELVKLALPQACLIDKPLCTRVGKYLERYSRDYGVSHASAVGSVAHAKDGVVLPNQHGMPVDSKYELSAVAYAQPTDYFLVSAGAISYSGRTVPTGSMASLGTNWAQLDFGYRDHWLSPMTDSSTLMSTEAPTTPSVTLSNYEPLTRLGFQYEFFLSRLSSQQIIYNGNTAVGDPRLFGAQFSIEPFSGWSLGINRLLEYGGGAGLPSSPSTLLRNFFEPSGTAQTQGNQQASYISRFIVPSKTPFAVYFQYAGEDNSDGGSYLLGNPAISAGIDFPRIFRYFDATYEISEWSNIWYVHNIFQATASARGARCCEWVGSLRLAAIWKSARARCKTKRTTAATIEPSCRRRARFPTTITMISHCAIRVLGTASSWAPRPWAVGTWMATDFPDSPDSSATAGKSALAVAPMPMMILRRKMRITTERKYSSMRESTQTRCAQTWTREYPSQHRSWHMVRT
jgi:hypothetical protein